MDQVTCFFHADTKLHMKIIYFGSRKIKNLNNIKNYLVAIKFVKGLRYLKKLLQHSLYSYLQKLQFSPSKKFIKTTIFNKKIIVKFLKY